VRSRLCGLLELLEPKCQPVAIRTILRPSRPVDQCPGDPLEAEFEKWTIVDIEQPIRDVNSVIRVDADQVSIKGRMMELISGRPFETIGWPNCSSASMTM
jgi:hypothetical protein